MRSKLLGACLLGLALLVPTACGGSEVSPKEALAANQAILGTPAPGQPATPRVRRATRPAPTGDAGTATGDTGDRRGGTAPGAATGGAALPEAGASRSLPAPPRPPG